MHPFRYLVSLINGKYGTRAVLRPSMPEGEYLDTLATRSQLTRAQVEGLLTAQSALHGELARQGTGVDYVLRLFRVLPSCGGRYTGPNPAAQDVRDTLNQSIIIHPEVLDALRAECPLEKVGEVSEIGPIITSVRGRPGNVPNRYGIGLGQGMEVNGDHFRLSRGDSPWPTAVLVAEGEQGELPLAVLDCSPTRLLLSGAPAGTTGPAYLKIIEADGNFSTYDQPLTPIA